ncbi:MAG: hypothetical protein ACRDYA_22815 [Egibacteraceae bacterium]
MHAANADAHTRAETFRRLAEPGQVCAELTAALKFAATTGGSRWASSASVGCAPGSPNSGQAWSACGSSTSGSPAA